MVFLASFILILLMLRVAWALRGVLALMFLWWLLTGCQL